MSSITCVTHSASPATTRRLVRATAFVLVLVAVLSGSPKAPAHAESTCVPGTPAEMIQTATRYIQVYRDLTLAPGAPLAPNLRRAEFPASLPREQGGPVTAKSREDVLWYWMMPTLRFIKDFGQLRWIVDAPRCEVVLFWLMDFEAPAIPITVHLGERFRISNGLIEEIEIIQWRQPGADGSCWPANDAEGTNSLCAHNLNTTPYDPTATCSLSSAAITATARDYIDALESHDATGVSLDTDARRTEMPTPAGYAGPVTGTTGVAVAASLEQEARFQSVEGVRNIRFFVDEAHCEAVAFYLVDRAASDVTEQRVPMRGTSHHVTRFLVSGEQDPKILQIEDFRTEALDSRTLEGSCFPQAWDDVEDNLYREFPCPAVEG